MKQLLLRFATALVVAALSALAGGLAAIVAESAFAIAWNLLGWIGQGISLVFRPQNWPSTVQRLGWISYVGQLVIVGTAAVAAVYGFMRSIRDGKRVSVGVSRPKRRHSA